MARPYLPLGTYGTIGVQREGPSKYKARARYRGIDGTTTAVARYGQTKTEAENRLREALRDIQAKAGGPLNRQSKVADLAAQWLLEVDQSARAVNTKEQYRYVVDRYVRPTLGQLRIAEASTPRCDAALQRVAREHGKGAAKSTRSALTGMFRLAARHGLLDVNPVRETQPVAPRRKPARALTADEADQLVDALRADERAVMLDLPDLVDFGLATGCRIGEALAIREHVLDLDSGEVLINATAIRVKGKGMVIQERPKSDAGHRRLALPPFAVAMLLRRREELRLNPPAVAVLDDEGAIRQERVWVAFPAPLARSLRDPSNTAADLREAFDRHGFDWLTFHTLRKTVGTRMDEAGMSEREIADQLGHANPSLTQDVYMGRKVKSERAAAVLDR